MTSKADLIRRAREFEQDPHETDVMDMDAFLRDCGFECEHYEGAFLYTSDQWGLQYAFRDDVRYVPGTYVVAIAAAVRGRLERRK